MLGSLTCCGVSGLCGCFSVMSARLRASEAQVKQLQTRLSASEGLLTDITEENQGKVKQEMFSECMQLRTELEPTVHEV